MYTLFSLLVGAAVRLVVSLGTIGAPELTGFTEPGGRSVTNAGHHAPSAYLGSMRRARIALGRLESVSVMMLGRQISDAQVQPSPAHRGGRKTQGRACFIVQQRLAAITCAGNASSLPRRQSGAPVW